MSNRHIESSFITLSLKVYRQDWETPIYALCTKLNPEILVIRKEYGSEGTHPHLHILMHKHTSVRADKMKERFYKVISKDDRDANPKWYMNTRVPSVLEKLSYLKKIDEKAIYLKVNGELNWAEIPVFVPNNNKVLLDRAYKSMSVTLNRKNFCFFVAEYVKHHNITLNGEESFHLLMVRMAEDKVNFSELITLVPPDTFTCIQRQPDSFSNLYWKYYEYILLLL